MKPSQDLKSPADLRKMDLKKLNEELQAIQYAYFKVKFEAGTTSGSVDLPQKYRRQIAKIKTVMHQKNNEKAKEEPKAEKEEK